MKSNIFKYCMLALCLNLPIALSEVFATTVEYTYDELGRLTFVSDNVNGNRDYDYDAAGNRVSVSIEGDTDEPLPGAITIAQPTGLSTYGPISQQGGYPSRWNAVAHADYYIFRTKASKEYTTTSTSITKEAEADWVMACSNIHGCGPKANF